MIERIGPYTVLEKLGEGGMGQVYRATDTTLGRQVAIKILPDAFAGDAERLARFEREAKTLASLNHPHIAAIYGFEKSAGMSALVMELVEGEDLSQRIAGSAIPIDEALPIAWQIAEALEAAHEQGVVHRDLKPANIKLRADGTVKVLDFGLARVGAPVGSSPDALNSPTFTSPAALTIGGMILGTAAYMAREQARGKTVDKRADIWAFGLVLYEMLVGRTAFGGDTISDVLAAVLTREPDWTALPATTPAPIKRLLARCLEKDPKRRLRDIGDARLEIEETIRDPIADPSPVAAAPRVRPFAWTAVGFAVAAIVIVGLAASGVWPRARISEARPLRLSIVHTEGSEVGAPAISPDGRRVAYRARRSDGMPLLWVRDLASSEAQPLEGHRGLAALLVAGLERPRIFQRRVVEARALPLGPAAGEAATTGVAAYEGAEREIRVRALLWRRAGHTTGQHGHSGALCPFPNGQFAPDPRVATDYFALSHRGEPRAKHCDKETHRHYGFISNQSHYGVTPSLHQA